MRNPVFLGLAAVLLVAADRPDFSGEWKIDPGASRTAPIAPPKTQTLTIVHRDPEMSVAQRTATGLPRDYRYLTNGEMTRNESPHGAKLESRAVWDGTGLSIRTLMSTSLLSATMQERWSLSADGKTLEIDRQGKIHVYRKKK